MKNRMLINKIENVKRIIFHNKIDKLEDEKFVRHLKVIRDDGTIEVIAFHSKRKGSLDLDMLNIYEKEDMNVHTSKVTKIARCENCGTSSVVKTRNISVVSLTCPVCKKHSRMEVRK